MTSIGDPAPLAMGGFATTLMSVSLAMMDFRGVSTQTMFIGNLCFVACIGLLISAQWAMAKGDTFSYTVLTAFSLFYGGYGVLMIPGAGVAAAYGGLTPEYYNAFGFFILVWAVLNTLFLVASLPKNLVYICIFTCIEFCLLLDATSQFRKADGRDELYASMQKAAGAFGFIASLLGYYATAHYLLVDPPWPAIPIGDTSSWFVRRCARDSKELEV